MIRFENIEVMGFRAALRGMRNPLNSWHLADSQFKYNGDLLEIGPNDLKLLCGLSGAGRSHRKALRMIHVQMDVIAPLYWWKDYDTYKVSTVANGCSTMHKIHANEFTLDDFAHDHLDERGIKRLLNTIDDLNYYRDKFLASDLKDKEAWYCMIQLLPSSYMQRRTIDFNYETTTGIIFDRRLHKLDEFREFTALLQSELPYMHEIVQAIRKGSGE